MLTDPRPSPARARVAAALLAWAVLADGRPPAVARVQPPGPSQTEVARAAAAARAELAFVRAASRALAHGARADAESLARARGAADPAAAAVLARLAADQGRYEDALAIVQLPGAANATSAAALEWGRLLLTLGRTAEARRVLAPLAGTARRANTPEAMVRAGLAAQWLGQTRTSHTLFREAAAQSKNDPAANTAWGALFLDAHNPAEAAASFRAAIQGDPEWAPAHAGLARALADEDGAAAEASARRALALDPNLVDAHVFLAEFALDRDREADARRALDHALAVNPRHLDALALSAALDFVSDDAARFDATVARALAINPSFGDVYRVAAEQAARRYRYDDAATLARKAVAVDGDNPRAQAALGLHLLRTGDEREARRALEAAFRADPYDLVTYNLLQMLDTLETFASIPAGDAIVRLDRDEAPILRLYAVPMVEEALAKMSERYDFRPTGPILVQVFPQHDHFAVRTAGLPGLLGALGACFGRVVTLDSPRARAVPGSFNWQSTLWHEMAHVFTLQLSNYRVPRWLTEGISVWEEGQVRPAWARDSELAFARAHAEGKVMPLAELNAGFTRLETIELAYFQASLVVAMLVEQHGHAAIGRLVRAFADGSDTEAALRKTIGTGVADVQTAFTAFLERRYAALGKTLRPPDGVVVPTGATPAALQALAERHRDSYPVQMAIGRALAAAGADDAAKAAYARAHALVPSATGPDSPRAKLAELTERRGDYAAALDHLLSLITDDHTNVGAARAVLPLARRLGRPDALWVAYEHIVTIDPFDASAHTGFGRMALERREVALATREFRAALASGPVDPASAHCDLADALVASGDLAGAKREVMTALEMAPSYERAQALLLRIVEGRIGAHDGA